MVKFYEANVHFYDSLASLTNALMDYLMAANGWNVHVRFPGITEITKSRLKNLLESELREIVINVSHVGWSLHPLQYRLSHHHWKSCTLFSISWFSVFQLNLEHRSSSLNAGRGGTELFPQGAGHSCPLILSSAGTSAIQRKNIFSGRNYIWNTAMLKNITTACK